MKDGLAESLKRPLWRSNVFHFIPLWVRVPDRVEFNS